MFIRNFADVSTAHLSPTAREWLEVKFETLETDGIYGYPGGPTGHGWFLWVPAADEIGEDHAGGYEMPADLIAILRHARDLGADYVLFGAGAPESDELPILDPDAQVHDNVAEALWIRAGRP